MKKIKLMTTKQGIAIYTNGDEYSSSNGRKFFDTFELIEYITINKLECVKIHENLLFMLNEELKDWINMNFNNQFLSPDFEEIEELKEMIDTFSMCKRL